MGKTATIYKDIGKACSDLLSKDYKVGKNTIEVKTKLPSGVTATPTVTKSGDSIAGTLAAKYAFAPWLTGEATLGTSGSVELNIEAADAITKGLTLTAECAKAAPGKPDLLASANLIAEYKQEAFTCKASFDPIKNDLLCNASTTMGDISAGLDCSYCTRKGALQKYAAACQFVQPEFIVGAKCESKSGNMTLGCSYFHKVSGDMQLGVALSKPLAKPDVGIEFGTAYKIDKDTTVKGKVNSDGMLFTSYKQKLSSLTTMTLAAQIDTINLADNKHKFGVALNFTP
jgi:voltage-dependent anion channel protein 2